MRMTSQYVFCGYELHQVMGTFKVMSTVQLLAAAMMTTKKLLDPTMMLCRSTRSSAKRLLLQTATRPLGATQHLSTAPKVSEKETLSLPPNLTIDARSSCSPVYGLERVRTSAALEEEEYDGETEQEESETKDDSVEEEEEEDEDEEYASDVDDEEAEEIMYDLSTRPEPFRAIPLPDRLHVTVHDKLEDKEVGTLYLSPVLFGHDTIRVDLLARTVQYQRNQKRGKRKAITKTISEVSGSGRKVRPQKGTGQARAGHSRPAHWRGGAKAHGPKGSIQDYSNCKLNKQTRKLALCHALSQKLKEGNFILVNDLTIESHKTKELALLLQKWDIGGRHGTTAYILDHLERQDEQSWKGVPVNLSVAAKNIYKVKVSNQLMANVYDILKHEKLVMTIAAVTALEARMEHLMRY